MERKIVISVNTAWNIYNFRSGLIKALANQGYQIVAVAPQDEYADYLSEIGCRFINIPMDKNGANPVRDLALLMRYFHVLRAEMPFAYLGYTIKPNVYGSIAAHMLRIPVINNIAGLGAAFINKSPITSIARYALQDFAAAVFSHLFPECRRSGLLHSLRPCPDQFD